MKKSKPRLPKAIQTLRRNIRAQRKQQGLSLEALSEKAHMDWAYIGRVERGTINICMINLGKIAKGLGCKLQDYNL